MSNVTLIRFVDLFKTRCSNVLFIVCNAGCNICYKTSSSASPKTSGTTTPTPVTPTAPKPPKPAATPAKKKVKEKSFPGPRSYKMPEDYSDYSHWSTYIERDWNRRFGRVSYWATWKQERDMRRRVILGKWAPQRLRLAALMYNNVLPQALRDKAGQEFRELPKFASRWYVDGYCQLSGRRRGNVQSHRISRILFRAMADSGRLAGFTRAFW